jgi:hypothetical protein
MLWESAEVFPHTLQNMDRPERLPDEVAEKLEKLDRHELREASRYAERLAEKSERSDSSRSSVQFLFDGNDGSTYYETGLSTIRWDNDT